MAETTNQATYLQCFPMKIEILSHDMIDDTK